MDILASAPTGGNSGGPLALRTEAPPEHPDPPPIPTGEPLGYWFDAVPKSIRHDHRLKPIDHWIVAILVSLAIWRRDSCWTTMRFLASQIPAIRPGRSGLAVVCERTVQRSIKRLIDFGHLDRQPVPVPDPDQPGNTTGYRYFFRWHIDQAGGPPPSRGGVTKEPRGVTKLPPDPSDPPGGVTMESGDSLVTQMSIEVWEPEPTLNVAALASEGEDEPTATVETMAIVEPPPAAAPTPEATGEVPTAAAPPAVAPGLDAARESRARELIRIIRGHGCHLWPEGEEIRWELTPGGSKPDASQADQLRALRPEVLAVLRAMKMGPPRAGSPSGPPQASAIADAPPSGPPAPRVPREVQADVRARIGALAGNPSKPDVAATAQAMATALGPHQDEGRTVATFLGLAGEVRRGDMPEACLQEAFEEACRGGVRNRGAAFVAAVKRWRAKSGSARDRPGSAVGASRGRAAASDDRLAPLNRPAYGS